MRRAEYDDLMKFAFNMAGELVWNKDKYGSDPDLELCFYRLWRIARRHQLQLINKVGEILLYCEDLICTKGYLPIKYVWELRLTNIYERQTGYEDWYTCFELFSNHFDFVKKVESPQNIEETKKFLESKGEKISPDEDLIELALEYEDYWVRQEEGKVSMPVPFSEIYGMFEYWLCRRVCKYLGFKSNVIGGNLKRMYILVFTVCLYTAIRNELERLCNEMEDEGYEDVRERYGIPLDIRAEMQKLSENVTKQPVKKEEKEECGVVPISEAEIDALLSEKTEEEKVEPTEERKQEIERTLTKYFNKEGARDLLQRIKDAGLCNEYYDWDKSKWPTHEGDDVLALAYLAQEASKEKYIKAGITGDKKHVSWRAFHYLFNYSGKRVDRYGKTQLQIERDNNTVAGKEFCPLSSNERSLIERIVRPA